MLTYLSEALVASCLHCSVGIASVAVACMYHLLSSHFELILCKPVVILRVLQVRMPVGESTVAGYLGGKLGIHGLGEMRRISVFLTLVTLKEVIQALWTSSCLLLMQSIFFLSLQLLVLYIVSGLLSHVHQLKCLPIGISDDVNFLHAGWHSLGAMTRLRVCF